jgi:hypothetical protein
LAKPVHDAVEDNNWMYKFLLLFDIEAVIDMFNGPPVTENVYQPSFLKVPVHPDMFGVS